MAEANSLKRKRKKGLIITSQWRLMKSLQVNGEIDGEGALKVVGSPGR